MNFASSEWVRTITSPLLLENNESPDSPPKTQTSTTVTPWQQTQQTQMHQVQQQAKKATSLRKEKKIHIDLKPKAKKEDPHDIIDMTGDEKIEDLAPGTPLEVIRSHHSLYFNYDPRGWSDYGLPSGFCEYCHCPLSYCAEKVFGSMTFKASMHTIKDKGWHKFSSKEVMDIFEREYNTMLHYKLLWNNIKHETIFPYSIPICLKYGSLKKLIKVVEKNKKREDAILWDRDNFWNPELSPYEITNNDKQLKQYKTYSKRT